MAAICSSQTLIPETVEEVETHGDSEVARGWAWECGDDIIATEVSQTPCVSDARIEMCINKETRA
jgi:hypothetical protein